MELKRMIICLSSICLALSCGPRVGRRDDSSQNYFITKEFADVKMRVSVPRDAPFIKSYPRSVLIQMHQTASKIEPSYFIKILINRMSPEEYKAQKEKSLVFTESDFGKWRYDYHPTLEVRTEKEWRTIRVDKKAPDNDVLVVEGKLYLPVLSETEIDNVNRIIESIQPLK